MRLLCLFLAALPLLQAEVKLPSLLGDGMVLQRQAPVRIYGRANPAEPVTVRFAGQSVSTAADAQGRWEAWLKPMEAGGPFEMTIAGGNTITLRDVLVGEVWVASGQSNMQWPVERSRDAEKEVVAANYPKLRLFKVALKVADQPLDDVSGAWQACTPETVKSFSAVAYFFGRHLVERLGVPVGMIQSAWGGTPAEAWTSRRTLVSDASLQFFLNEWEKVLAAYPETLGRYEEALKKSEAAGRPKPAPPRGPGHQHSPAGLYNAMIAPLTPYAIRGAIWYQGENNAGNGHGYIYRHLFESMIRDWRASWGLGDFPFLFVQLANYGKAPANGHWPLIQEAQAKTLELRGTGMAVTADIGAADNIHPTNKQDVGLRLGLAARALVYGEKVVYSGPMFRQATREGNRMRLWFDHIGGGLRAKDGALKGFVLAGPDRAFHPAEAEIDGETIIVSSARVAGPAAVRYAFADNPECNLYNAEGLPAVPFRSDDWRVGQ